MKRSTTTGRPPLDDDDRSVPVHLLLPSRVYDDVWKRARVERVSVPEIIRRDMQAARTRKEPE